MFRIESTLLDSNLTFTCDFWLNFHPIQEQHRIKLAAI